MMMMMMMIYDLLLTLFIKLAFLISKKLYLTNTNLLEVPIEFI